MGTDLFKYIFDESKQGGCKSVIAVIIKVAAFFIGLSPVLIYVLIYQLDKINNIFISSTLILGCSSLLFFIVFMASKVFSSILLEREIKTNTKMKEEEIEAYYFKKTFLIATIFQGILSIIILSNHYTINKNIDINQFKELFVAIVVLATFLIVSFIVWIISLLRYIKALELKLENESLNVNDKSLIDLLKDNEELSKKVIRLLEEYKKEMNN